MESEDPRGPVAFLLAKESQQQRDTQVDICGRSAATLLAYAISYKTVDLTTLTGQYF